MPTGKQNDINDRLYNLDHIPEGFAFSKERVWQNIKDNVPEKKTGRVSWPLAAAAVFIMILAGAFWMKGDDMPHPAVRKNTGEKLALQRITSPDKPPVNTIAGKIPLKPTMAADENTRVDKNTLIASEADVIYPDTAVVNPVVADARKDSIIQKAAPVQRKYPVAHINDLYKGPGPGGVPAQKVLTVFRRTETEALPDPEEKDTISLKQRTVFSFLVSQKQ
jgi:hypothetical protein